VALHRKRLMDLFKPFGGETTGLAARINYN
jgi:hypothetical protein